MTDGATTSPGEPEAGRGRRGGREPLKRVVRFVTVFVVSVLVLLTGYRYAIPTKANDWYLFQVARHTSWLLGYLGHSSEVEGRERIKDGPAVVRARIAAWERGEEIANEPPVADGSSPPLTRWERWRYRALALRRDGEPKRDLGPFVSFVLRPGLLTRLRDAKERLAAMEKDPAADEVERAALAAEIEQITQARDAARNSPDEAKAFRGAAFPFTLVPDCGAIPSMSIFCAAVLAFPTRRRKRLVGIVAGLPVLYGVNCARLACLAVIGAWDRGAGHGGKYFTFAHEYVWQGIYIVFVVAIWMIWLEFVVKARGNGRSPAH